MPGLRHFLAQIVAKSKYSLLLDIINARTILVNCEVDRILHTTELFPIVHPKKANEIKNKWYEPLLVVC